MKKKFKGELSEINPLYLSRDDKKSDINDFFLVLAVIYNDIKGLILFQKLVIDTYDPPSLDPNVVDVHSGEYGGIFVQITKLIIGIVHEFFNFLKEHKDVISSLEFINILDNTNKRIKQDWKDIIDIAFGKTVEGSDFAYNLMLIRNHVSFHYNKCDKKMRQSFCNMFFSRDKNKRNSVAYYSLGETMEEIRFFYADAVVQQYLISTAGKDGVDVNVNTPNMSEILNKMNLTISRLMRVYLKKQSRFTISK